MTQSAQSSGHEWVMDYPNVPLGHCTCGYGRTFGENGIDPEQYAAHVASVAQPAQSSGHEWRGTCFSQGGRFGNCECGDRKAQYITYAQHQAHLAHVAASVAHAAQPQEVPAPYFANGVPVDPMQPLTCDDMREITDACVHSDGSLTRDYRMMAVMANARAKAWLLGQTKPAPQEVPAEQPPCRICGAWLCSHLDDAPEPASAAKPPEDGLEARLMEILYMDANREAQARNLAAFIRTYQAARE